MNLLNLITTHLADPRIKSRKRQFCDARTIFSAIARKQSLSYQEIADMLGKHRTTIYDYERLCNPKNLGKNYEVYEKILNETDV
jgi:chromosomal replication initiation ATPase DnaA